MKILEHTISTKAGETQKLRWLIVQNRPYPTIVTECGRLKWQSAEGLFDRYQHPAYGLEQSYTAHLLTPDANPGEDYNRTHFAGCRDYTTKAISPGSIRFRGQDLGETSIAITAGNSFCDIKIGDGCTRATGSTRKMIEEKIIPDIQKFIAENAEALRNHAIDGVRKKFQTELAEARASLDQLEAEAAKAKF